MTLKITPQTHRRFILGKQGLWPGRRWAGITGVREAIEAIEAVQVDPVSVVSQSHDIVLWGRVLDYRPEMLHEAAYDQRGFFDYGGQLMIYPMRELPHWRTHMERCKLSQRWIELQENIQPAFEKVRSELRQRGPLRNRDIDGQPVQYYRGSKDTSMALYYLWLTGELMTYRRAGKERVYAFREDVAPEAFSHAAPVQEAEYFFARKACAHQGLASTRTFRNAWRHYIGRDVDLEEAGATLAGMLEGGEIGQVQIEGQKETHYALSEDLAILEGLQNGHIPEAWQPLETTTAEEVTLLSPLEYATARGRAAVLFDFAYTWEIYKPATTRVYGPYTMPILYGDRLPARLDAKLDRASGTLVINGFWMEDWFEPTTEFATALGKGLKRFGRFLDAENIDLDKLAPESLGEHARSILA